MYKLLCICVFYGAHIWWGKHWWYKVLHTLVLSIRWSLVCYA